MRCFHYSCTKYIKASWVSGFGALSIKQVFAKVGLKIKETTQYICV